MPGAGPAAEGELEAGDAKARGEQATDRDEEDRTEATACRVLRLGEEGAPRSCRSSKSSEEWLLERQHEWGCSDGKEGTRVRDQVRQKRTR
jgi:hypothetical protein